MCACLSLSPSYSVSLSLSPSLSRPLSLPPSLPSYTHKLVLCISFSGAPLNKLTEHHAEGLKEPVTSKTASAVCLFTHLLQLYDTAAR